MAESTSRHTHHGWHRLPLELKQQVISSFLVSHLKPYFASLDRLGPADCFTYHTSFMKCLRLMSSISFAFGVEASAPLRLLRRRLEFKLGELSTDGKADLLTTSRFHVIGSPYSRQRRRATARLKAEIARLQRCSGLLNRVINENSVREASRPCA